MFAFWINNGLLKFTTFFLLIWSTCCLVSAKKDCFLFNLNSRNVSVSFLSVLYAKLWFSVFDTTSFHNFFLFLVIGIFFTFFSPFYHIIIFLTVYKLPYWRSKKHNWTQKDFKGKEYGFNGFDTPFFKNLIELFTFVFNCRF